MKIGISIVNFNKKDLLRSCLKSLVVSASEHNIIVVDNGSTDQSVKIVRNEFTKINIIEMKKNSGFYEANNAGIKKALESVAMQ